MKPILYISQCLSFAPVRYNGEMIPDDFIEKLKLFVEFKTFCPEVEMGMGVPRPTVRLELHKNQLHLVQPETKKDFTIPMQQYSLKKLQAITDCDGFIFKAKSPSCGIKDAKIYSEKLGPALGKRNGFFSDEILTAFPSHAIASEKQLLNEEIREKFLTQIFMTARFRTLKSKSKLNELINFHAQNKYLMLAYNEKTMRELGSITANKNKLTSAEVFSQYEEKLKTIFLKPLKRGTMINVLMHGFGFVSDGLSPKEKKSFLLLLEKYRAKKIPLGTCLAVLKTHAERFGEEYLLSQSLFSPYPDELTIS